MPSSRGTTPIHPDGHAQVGARDRDREVLMETGRKRSRNEMEVDSENDNVVGGDVSGRGTPSNGTVGGRAPHSQEDRGGKRYHREASPATSERR